MADLRNVERSWDSASVTADCLIRGLNKYQNKAVWFFTMNSQFSERCGMPNVLPQPSIRIYNPSNPFQIDEISHIVVTAL